jgi:aryl-alcohol dehydrogenase-like predicted oxidoreductase
MKLHRRQFIGSTLAGLGGLIAGSRAQTLEPGPRPFEPFDPFEKVPLGKTGLMMSRVGLGTGMSGFNRQSNQTRLGQEKFTELVLGCYERGINWFDSADLYGSHSFIRNALATVPRDKYLLVSKLWFRKGGMPILGEERPDADKMIERFLTELGTDYIDLVLLHCMTDADWNSKLEKQMELMAEMKQKGTIRAHGVSCHSLDALSTAAEEPWVDSIHERINPYGVHMDDSPEKVVPLFQRAHDNGKGIVGMKIMGAGGFRNSDMKRDHSIEFAFNLPCVDVMTVGFESAAETDDFVSRVKKAIRRPEAPIKT